MDRAGIVSRTIGIDAGGSSIRTAIVERSTGCVVREERFDGRNLLINSDTVDVLAGIISGSGAATEPSDANRAPEVTDVR